MAFDAEARTYARSFSMLQRKAIKRLFLIDEPISNMPGVGQITIDQLVGNGIVTGTGKHCHDEPTYTLTDVGKELSALLLGMNYLPR
jgi:hypothetical protein